MAKFLMSKRKITGLSNGVFVIGIGLLVYSGYWWPGILLVLWATLGVRQYLSDRKFDLAVTSVVLFGLFGITILNLTWDVLMPVLFVIGGIYIIFREFFFAEDTNGEEKSVEIEEDIDT